MPSIRGLEALKVLSLEYRLLKQCVSKVTQKLKLKRKHLIPIPKLEELEKCHKAKQATSAADPAVGPSTRQKSPEGSFPTKRPQSRYALRSRLKTATVNKE